VQITNEENDHLNEEILSNDTTKAILGKKSKILNPFDAKKDFKMMPINDPRSPIFLEQNKIN